MDCRLYDGLTMYLYAPYCPVAAATTVVGDYWTPLIVRELLYGTCRFNQLARNLPNISRTLLASRLKTLERAGVVDCERSSRNVTSYSLTEAGRDLDGLITAMNDWGLRWGARDPNPEDLDPVLVICMLKDRIHTSALPDTRVVIEVSAVGKGDATAWLVCEHQGVSMCFDPPGLDIDLWVRGGIQGMYSIWLQHTSMKDSLRNGTLTVHGSTDLVKSFHRWFDGATLPLQPRTS